VLAVVEHDQQLAVGQRPHHARHRVRSISFRNSQRLGDQRRNERGIGQGGQLDQPGAIPEAAVGQRCHPQRQPGLTAPARTGQRDHPAAAEPLTHCGDLEATAHQRAHLGRQPRLPLQET